MNIKDLLIKIPQTAKIACLQDGANIRINQFASLIGSPSGHPKIVIPEYKNHF